MNEGLWSTGGMILTGGNRIAGSKDSRSGTLSTTNPRRTGLGLNLDVRVDRPVTNRLRHGTAIRPAHTVYLCVLCVSQNKQRLFPHTALTDWFS
jgi:hypothetical protein